MTSGASHSPVAAQCMTPLVRRMLQEGYKRVGIVFCRVGKVVERSDHGSMGFYLLAILAVLAALLLLAVIYLFVRRWL